MVITKTDQAGDPLLGACFALIQPAEGNEGGKHDRRRCDAS